MSNPDISVSTNLIQSQISKAKTALSEGESQDPGQDLRTLKVDAHLKALTRKAKIILGQKELIDNTNRLFED